MKLFIRRYWLPILMTLAILGLAYWAYSAYQEFELVWQAVRAS